MKLKLNRTILSALFLSFIISNAQSQEGGINFGSKVGANFSVLNTDNINASEESVTGLTAGLFIEIIAPSSVFAFQAELLYSEQGADLNSNILNEEISLDYLQAPLLAKFRFLKIVNLHAGPQLGFLTNEVGSENFETKDFDISGVAGIGLEIGKLRADLRYHFGLTETVETIKATNLYYAISIGYEFL